MCVVIVKNIRNDHRMSEQFKFSSQLRTVRIIIVGNKGPSLTDKDPLKNIKLNTLIRKDITTYNIQSHQWQTYLHPC